MFILEMNEDDSEFDVWQHKKRRRRREDLQEATVGNIVEILTAAYHCICARSATQHARA